MSSTESKGLQLIREMNIVRAALKIEPLAALVIPGWPQHLSVSDALREAWGAAAFADAIDVDGTKVISLAYPDAETAQHVGEATGQPFNGRDVALAEALDSLSIADTFGLVFAAQGSEPGSWKLAGWIEPTDADHSLWHLHKLPGDLYPAGHEPGRAP
jgi:hypothetical protein